MIHELTESKSKFVIITDTHFYDKNISSRKDYVKDCVTLLENIVDLIKGIKQKEPEYKIYICFLGDIFHRSFKNEISYNCWIQNLLLLRSICNGIYSVVGNHEITYFQQNPFWGATNEINSEYVKSIGMCATGSLPIINIVDGLKLFNYNILFNHYNSPITHIFEGHNFLLSHNFFASKENYEYLIEKVKSNKYLSKGYKEVDDNSPIREFELVFMGHMHLCVDSQKFYWDDGKETLMFYLGSLGQTSRTDVEASLPYRNIPVITIDGKDKHSLTMFEQDVIGDYQSLNLIKLKKDDEKKEKKKEKENILNQLPTSVVDPTKAIEEALKDNPALLELYFNLPNGMPDRISSCL